VQSVVLEIAQKAGYTARREEKADDRTRPGDVFISRFDANGPAAVDVSVRHPLQPSNPIHTAAAREKWHENQEKDKEKKYTTTCQRLGWTFIPFIMDCYGGMGDRAQAFLTQCLKMLLSQQESWQRRHMEATVWQDVGMALARELARQLVWGLQAEVGMDCGGPIRTSHNPYLS
jgi:hypothetical protein